MISIYLLGNSPTFISAVQIAYPRAKILVLPWRDCSNAFEKHKTSSPDILLVCGYDYKSSQYQYQNYYDKNISNPYHAIELIAGDNTTIFYINTIAPKNRFTFSRYLFAKNNLGYLLQCNFPQFVNISIPTIIDEKEGPQIHGGPITKLLFSTLIKFKVVDAIKKELLAKNLEAYSEKKKSFKITMIDGRFLEAKRSLFTDRLLRIVCG